MDSNSGLFRSSPGAALGRGPQTAGRQLLVAEWPGSARPEVSEPSGGGWGRCVSGGSSEPKQEAVRSSSRPHSHQKPPLLTGTRRPRACPAVLPEPRCGGAGLEGRVRFRFIQCLGVYCRLPATLDGESLQGLWQEWGSLTHLTQHPGVQPRHPPSGRGQPTVELRNRARDVGGQGVEGTHGS